MSALLQVATRNGGITYTDAAGVPDHFDAGIPFEADGSVAVADQGAINHYWQGLPFTAAGRLCVAVSTPVNLHVNPTFQGGAASGPGPGEFPPTGFSIGFNTVNSGPVGLDQWGTNPEEASGRGYLTYSIFDNNPGLAQGVVYRYGMMIENQSNGNYGAAMSFSGQSNITIIDSSTNVSANSTAFCFADFTVDDPVWSIDVRQGTGTTSNNVTSLILNPVSLALVLESTSGTLSDAWGAMLDLKLPGATGNNTDDWFALLGSLGHEGNINDRELEFWDSGGIFP